MIDGLHLGKLSDESGTEEHPRMGAMILPSSWGFKAQKFPTEDFAYRSQG